MNIEKIEAPDKESECEAKFNLLGLFELLYKVNLRLEDSKKDVKTSKNREKVNTS